MWESKEQPIDLSYNADELWFKGVYGQPVNKPLEIRKWEENTKFFKLLDKTYPRSKADRILTDLSLIALTYSKQAVQQRLTFKPKSKGENSAPVVFQYDPNGDLLELVLELRSAQPATPAEEPKPSKDSSLVADGDFDEAEISKTFFVEPKAERMLRLQKEMIEEWITGSGDPRDDGYEPPRAASGDRHALELYSQLTNDEFLYVQELQRVYYDESRCFFVQWVICKETKELVNSARISALHQGRKFTWVDTRLEILKSLTDVTLTARFLALSRLKRQNGSTAKLWLSQVMTRRAMLEDPKLPAPVHLPETLYLEITVGQLSAQETTVFDCPCIADDLDKKDRSGNYVWTLEKLKRVVDQCSNPPAFRGVKTPITELLEHDPTKTSNKPTPRDKGSGPPEHKRKLNARAAEKDSHPDKHGKRPPHERPAIFPKGLKRPDLNATFEGQAVASEFQQKLYDDIAHGNCVRCHSKGHARSTWKEPVARWEAKFDTEKEKYWAGTLKWQLKAAAEPASTKTKPTTPPTLVQKPAATDGKKKESHRQTIRPASPDLWDDDVDTRLQSRAGSLPRWGMKHAPPDSDDDDSELSPEELRDAIITSTDMLMIDYSDEDAFDILFSDPFFEILRQTRHTSLVLFSGGIHGVFFTSEVDIARAHHARPPPQAMGTTFALDDGSRLLSADEISTLATEVCGCVSTHFSTLITSARPAHSSRAPCALDARGGSSIGRRS
jgi:hypothetical protein